MHRMGRAPLGARVAARRHAAAHSPRVGGEPVRPARVCITCRAAGPRRAPPRVELAASRRKRQRWKRWQRGNGLGPGRRRRRRRRFVGSLRGLTRRRRRRWRAIGRRTRERAIHGAARGPAVGAGDAVRRGCACGGCRWARGRTTAR
eukprot:362542-Chlamydomonas_euryale.AAC.7